MPEPHDPPTTLDAWIDAVVRPMADALSSVVFFEVTLFGVDWPLVVVWLVAGGIYFTIALSGINLRGLPTALRVLRGRYDDPDPPGQVTHFQALATALSGTVGIGNIGGVAVAIAAGGPGATFWMVVAGVLGMATKFAECTLGVRYRRLHPDGTVSGGPMHYLERGLAELGLRRMGKALGTFYAAGIVVGCLGIGNMFQSNQAAIQLKAVTGGAETGLLAGQGWLIGIVLAIIVGLVILGGIQSIASVTSRLVPLMAGLYLAGALTLLALNAEVLPAAVLRIVTEAFTAPGIAGGMFGVMIIGFRRAVFSNEAGIGSAAIAHAAVKTKHPATEGYVALLEPLIDTVVVCTITALVITTTAELDPTFLSQRLEGVALTSDAFARRIGWSPYLIAIAAMLFGISTMISWAYYGLKGWTYLVGRSPTAMAGYKVVFCLFVALGASINLEAVLDFSDAMVFVLCIPNLAGIILLTPILRRELERLRKRGPNPR
ncbi:MAG: alanine:cation symporter family protein [Deltaproteobacteria bacterium]|nr:MAG: alanine:cation symporter family protein [Deltaproteobacteria bacterium]